MKVNKIFFSYSRKDKGFALKLALDLKKENYDVWIDQEDIRAGSEWDVEIEKALTTCDCLLFIQSENSVASNNVLDEVYYALGENKTVIPVVISNCKTPYRINRLQRISFIDDYNTGLNNLKDNLNNGSFPEISSDEKETINPSVFRLKYLIPALLVIVAVITFFYFKRSLSTTKEVTAQSFDAGIFVGDWVLKNIDQTATDKNGYLKIDTTGDGKANIKSSFQFYYAKANDTAFLNVFNGFVECSACVLKNEMTFTDKQIDIGAQKYSIIKTNKNKIDTTLNAGTNTSIRAIVTLNLISKDSAIIKVVNPDSIKISYNISVAPFTYSFIFKKNM